MSESDPLPSSGWADHLFRLSGPEVCERARASGASELVALRLSELIEALRSATERAPLTFAELVADPGQVLARLDTREAWRTSVAGGTPTEAVLVPELDLALLIGLLIDRAERRWATGADLYARFSHPGPPHPIATNPPPELPYRTPTLQEALRRTTPEIEGAAEGTIADPAGLRSPDTDQVGTASKQGMPDVPGNGTLTPGALDEVGRLLAQVYTVFGADMGWWLRIPNMFLNNFSPLDCLGTPEGRRALDDYLTHLAAGSNT